MPVGSTQQLKAPIGSMRNYEVSEITDIDGSNNTVQGAVRLTRTDRGILVEGTLHTEIELTCSRCLSLFNCPLTLNIEEEYFITRDPISGLPLPPPTEAGAFLIDENHILDLGEAVRQYKIMALPMNPVCRQDCAGLCPQCGRNLNYGACDCPAAPPDPRWAKLQLLRSAKRPRGRRPGRKKS
jgi:uncharacterized protein